MSDFDRVAKGYNRFMSFFKLDAKRNIYPLIKTTGSETILDIGGGTGVLAACLAENTKSYIIVDPSKEMLNQVPFHTKIIKNSCSIEEWNCDPESIDIIVITDVLHHLKNPYEVINNAMKWLRPGGQMYIMDFEKSKLRTKILEHFERNLFGYVNYFSKSDFELLLQKKMDVTTVKSGWNFILKGVKL